MKTRNLFNLLLLFIVLALIGLSIVTINNKQSKNITLLNIQRDDINQITIPRDQGDIVLYKNSDDWIMTQPYTARAHSFRIDKLLDLLDVDIEKSYQIEPEKLQSFGLDTPRASIVFNDQAVHFGKTNPVSNKRYIQAGKFITLIDDQLYPLISSQPSSFIDLKLFDGKHRITSLHLPDFSLTQQTDGKWTSTSPQPPAADQIQSLLEHWQHAQAFAVHAYMERKQLGTVHIDLSPEQIVEFNISETSPWLILGQKQLGIEYHFDSAMYTRLFTIEKPAALP
ncbi:MAG: DUF4340 domain-containing protein [Gammaproteobacteria bacterium]|nr:DUF4340 domain-containing protein [Gammaproteobacteria bacterium]